MEEEEEEHAQAQKEREEPVAIVQLLQKFPDSGIDVVD